MYEIDFHQAGNGNGDAITIRYSVLGGEPRCMVVDGGFSDTCDRVIGHCQTNYAGVTTLTDVVLSHGDNDHAAGLVGVLRHFNLTGALWMNRPWLYARQTLPAFHGNYSEAGLVAKIRDEHPFLVELEEIANAKGIPIHPVFQGQIVGPFRVMAPSALRYLTLIPDFDKTPTPYNQLAAQAAKPIGIFEQLAKMAKKVAENWGIETLSADPQPPTSASNESSAVLLGDLDTTRVLLTSDAGPQALNEAADYAAANGWLSPPAIVQVPHHGSRHNVTPAVLNRWLGPIKAKGTVTGNAYCCVGSGKADYPRAQVQNAFERRGYPVYATRAKVVCTYGGGAIVRPGWEPARPEVFATEVEAI